MRGKVIHYNGNDGKGLIAAEGQQHPFEISQWHSDSAPAVNQTVELDLEQGKLVAVRRITEEALLKEKAGELAGKFGKRRFVGEVEALGVLAVLAEEVARQGDLVVLRADDGHGGDDIDRIGDQRYRHPPLGGVADIANKTVFQLPVGQAQCLRLRLDLAGVGLLAPANKHITWLWLIRGCEASQGLTQADAYLGVAGHNATGLCP